MNSTCFPCDAATKERLRSLITGAGACAVGFARNHNADLSRLDSWIDSGMNGCLDYMTRNRHLRQNPAGLLEDCRTVVSIAFPYFRAGQPRSALFADYALSYDYHEVLRKILAPVCQRMEEIMPGTATRICVDSAPVLERQWAVEAGVGFIGANRQLIVPGIGSKVFLCEILWTAEVEPDAPCSLSCGNCGACFKACPAAALSEAGVDARRCLSCLTVELRDELPEGTTLKGRICGCDVCQDVCPHNATPPAALIAEFEPRPEILNLQGSQIDPMTQEEFSATFRHSTIKRLKLAGLKRNMRAKGNLNSEN